MSNLAIDGGLEIQGLGWEEEQIAKTFSALKAFMARRIEERARAEEVRNVGR